MDVAVVGGGVIGLCVAEALERRGASVTVIEAGRCGAAASAGNGGWITPGLSNPLPAPGTMRQALRWMLNPASPLLVRPSLRPDFLKWSYAFWRSTTPRRYGAGMAALVALSDRTVAGFDALAAAGVEFEMHADGLLFVATTEHALADEERVMREQQALGYRGDVELLDGNAARSLEPALGPAAIGGILAAAERHVRPETLTAGLVAHLRRQGVEVREQARATRIDSDGNGWRVRLDGADEAAVTCDRLVLAMGADSASLLAPLGIRLPLAAAKGYSVTEQAPTIRPRRPLYLLEAKVGVSPYAGGVRLSGTLELGSDDLSLREKRLAALDHAAQRYLTGWEASANRLRWAGLRPLLPDGLPAIGPAPGWENLFVAAGHSMLGVTLAPATADALAPVVLDGGVSQELSAFSLARFDNRGHVHDPLPA